MEFITKPTKSSDFPCRSQGKGVKWFFLVALEEYVGAKRKNDPHSWKFMRDINSFSSIDTGFENQWWTWLLALPELFEFIWVLTLEEKKNMKKIYVITATVCLKWLIVVCT